jgi:hypothetical protein
MRLKSKFINFLKNVSSQHETHDLQISTICICNTFALYKKLSYPSYMVFEVLLATMHYLKML